MIIYTIGFTKKSAEQFFNLLRQSGAKKLIDIRLNNVSQLAGFAKRDDLRYFLHEICGMDYVHRIDLAPTKEMLDDYKKNGASWKSYEDRFLELMRRRRIEDTVPQELIDNSVLLCSEEKAHHCHRRLVAEYLAQHWENVTIQHLG
ncbi:DUF488 family protein [Thermomonospora catenispora]|uniref:DUF488 domain-containing protein n=1 Tax=Thermomonospora catenispora TaxID=2493090 RepID=UPI0011200422|nr:DUF488 domain-containing protein [Thermomonospora catenispora]TNY38157.1 DUF488 domain-containing protein [Thermomonospora catenispora]